MNTSIALVVLLVTEDKMEPASILPTNVYLAINFLMERVAL